MPPVDNVSLRNYDRYQRKVFARNIERAPVVCCEAAAVMPIIA